MPVPVRVLICLPHSDFDPTEAATPWHRFREAGFRVSFATPQGRVATCDPLMLTGPLFGRLGAEPVARERYHRMEQSPEFQRPVAYEQVDPAAYHGLTLPGGHAPGMRAYLDDEGLHAIARGFLAADKPVGAICHGVVVLARTVDPSTGRSVLYDREVTALLKVLERSAFWLTAWKLGRYYRTSPAYVEDEVQAALRRKRQFRAGPAAWQPFAVTDRNLVTARWPKDAEVFADELIGLLAPDRG